MLQADDGDEVHRHEPDGARAEESSAAEGSALGSRRTGDEHHGERRPPRNRRRAPRRRAPRHRAIGLPRARGCSAEGEEPLHHRQRRRPPRDGRRARKRIGALAFGVVVEPARRVGQAVRGDAEPPAQLAEREREEVVVREVLPKEGPRPACIAKRPRHPERREEEAHRERGEVQGVHDPGAASPAELEGGDLGFSDEIRTVSRRHVVQIVERNRPLPGGRICRKVRRRPKASMSKVGAV